MNPSPLIKMAPLAALVAAAALWLASPLPAQSADSAMASTAAEKIKRGEYLVNTAGCHDCHTPWTIGPNGPGPDMTLMLSGHPQSLVMPPPPKLPEGPWQVLTGATNTAFAGGWGVSFTANLTPDPETGLGKWTVENFKETIRSGRHMGRGREILPPMPWQVYRNMTDEDLEAVYSYLQSIPAITNQVPEPVAPEGAGG
jgi:mono/diheme cytochrome c family protein